MLLLPRAVFATLSMFFGVFEVDFVSVVFNAIVTTSYIAWIVHGLK